MGTRPFICRCIVSDPMSWYYRVMVSFMYLKLVMVVKILEKDGNLPRKD